MRELEPGEFLRITGAEVDRLPPLPAKPHHRCIFELVYFSRPDSTIFGRSVDRVRRALGRELAREHPAPGADCVFSVPDSSNAMALGFAEETGIKLEHGLIRNHYVGRTFINPTQAGPQRQGEDQVQSRCATCWRASASWSWTIRWCAAPPARDWCR